MRVISGNSRGKKLIALDSKNTRPTLDRVKEALFSKIQYELQDAVVLDLFAGTGALGIEALSRGAKEAILCDASSKAIKIINKNLEETRLKDKAKVINTDFSGNSISKFNQLYKSSVVIELYPLSFKNFNCRSKSSKVTTYIFLFAYFSLSFDFKI